MSTQGNRTIQLEKLAPTHERQFVDWSGNPWTPEQKAAAIRRHPEQRVFWRSLLATTEAGGQRPEVRDQRSDGREPAAGNNIVTLDYAPHAAQMQIHRARDKRFRMRI